MGVGTAVIMGPFSGGGGRAAVSPAAAVAAGLVSEGSTGGGSATGPAAVTGPAVVTAVMSPFSEGSAATDPAEVAGPAAGPSAAPAICPARLCPIDELTTENGPDLAPDLGMDPDTNLGGDSSPAEDRERLPSLTTDPQLEDLRPLGRECDCRDLAGEGGCAVEGAAAAIAGCAATA